MRFYFVMSIILQPVLCGLTEELIQHHKHVMSNETSQTSAEREGDRNHASYETSEEWGNDHSHASNETSVEWADDRNTTTNETLLLDLIITINKSKFFILHLFEFAIIYILILNECFFRFYFCFM